MPTPLIHRLTLLALALVLVSGVARAQLPPPPDPVENPTTAAKAVLGKMLFFDEQLSSDDTVACGSCHRPASGGSDPRVAPAPGFDGLPGTADDTSGSPGIIRSDSGNDFSPDPTFGLGRQITPRFSPSFHEAAYFPELFWDGRAPSQFLDPDTGGVSIAVGGALESQAVGPPVSDVEMAHEARSWGQITAKLAAVTPMKLASSVTPDIAAALAISPTYPALFQVAFGSPGITSERIAFAIAAYERTLVPNQTPWDRFTAGDPTALNPTERAGLNLFTGRAGCVRCHGTPLFSDRLFHNIGLRPSAEDLGRQIVTGNPADRGQMKTPSLRNVGLRPRLMHTGQFSTLRQVVDFYNRGGDFADNRDPRIVPLGLTPLERDQIVAFLRRGLTDPRAAAETAPFDRPRLALETGLGAATLFGSPNAGTAGLTPRWLADSPAHIGAPDFKVGVADALGGAAALLGISLTAGPPGQNIGGVPVSIGLVPTPAFIPIVLGGGSGVGGEGFGTVQAPIPPAPGLIGRAFFGQWFIQDSGALGGFATTPGARFELF